MTTTKPSPDMSRAIRLLRKSSPWGLNVTLVSAPIRGDPKQSEPVAIWIYKKRILATEPLVIMEENAIKVGRVGQGYVEIRGDRVSGMFYAVSTYGTPQLTYPKNAQIRINMMFLSLARELKKYPHWYEARQVDRPMSGLSKRERL
jgi:hypothetical protein